MNTIDERLSTALRTATAVAVAPVSFSGVASRARRRQRVRYAVPATAAVAVAGVVAGVSLTTGGGDARVLPVVPATSTATPSPTPADTVTVQGLAFDMPAGWSKAVAQPCVEPDNHTVLVSDLPRGEAFAPCPFHSPAASLVTSVSMYFYYGSVASPPGTRITWQGQRAWLTTTQGRAVTELRLIVLSANAEVIVDAPDAATAHKLLDRVRYVGLS